MESIGSCKTKNVGCLLPSLLSLPVLPDPFPPPLSLLSPKKRPLCRWVSLCSLRCYRGSHSYGFLSLMHRCDSEISAHWPGDFVLLLSCVRHPFSYISSLSWFILNHVTNPLRHGSWRVKYFCNECQKIPLFYNSFGDYSNLEIISL